MMIFKLRSYLKPEVLTPTVIRLGMVSFFADISSEMLYPITPVFLTATLGASMLSLGLIEGVAEALASLLKVYAGSWSDRLKQRRPFIVTGYLFAALAKPIVGASHSWITVLFARGLDRTGKGIRTAPRDALLSDSVPDNRQGEAFGWHRMMDTLGAAVGPLCAVVFVTMNPGSLRPLFFWAVIPGLIAVGVALSVKEIAGSTQIPIAKTSTSKFGFRQTSPKFKRYLFAWTLFSLTNSSDAFLILKAKQSGNSLPTTILMYCFYNLVYALLSPSLGKLSDRIPRRHLLAAGLILFATVYIGFGLSTVAWHFWGLFGFYGLFMAATDGSGKAMIVDHVPKEFKATGLGLFATTTGLATLLASTCAGFLWDSYGSSFTFYFGAAGAMLSAVYLLFLKDQESSVQLI